MTRRSVSRAVCDALPWSIGEMPGTLPDSQRCSGGWMSFLRRWAGLLTVHPAMPIQTSRPPGFSGSCNAKCHQRKVQFSLHLSRSTNLNDSASSPAWRPSFNHCSMQQFAVAVVDTSNAQKVCISQSFKNSERLLIPRFYRPWGPSASCPNRSRSSQRHALNVLTQVYD
jgi:hypothetical protein